MNINLVGPESIGGVEYGLSSIYFCTSNQSGTAEITKHQVYVSGGTSATDYELAFLEDTVLTDGSTTIDVNMPVGGGTALGVTLGGPAADEVNLDSVSTTWTTGAAVPAALPAKADSAHNG